MIDHTSCKIELEERAKDAEFLRSLRKRQEHEDAVSEYMYNFYPEDYSSYGVN